MLNIDTCILIGSAKGSSRDLYQPLGSNFGDFLSFLDLHAVAWIRVVSLSLSLTLTIFLSLSQCFFPQNLIANVKTPLFLLNAAYDAWQVTFLIDLLFCMKNLHLSKIVL